VLRLRPPNRLVLVLAALGAGACTSSLGDDIDTLFSRPIPFRAEDSPLESQGPQGPAYTYPDIPGEDGNFTRPLWLPPGLGRSLHAILASHPDWTAAAPALAAEGGLFFRDPNVAETRPAWKDQAGLEPVLLYGPPEVLARATRLAQGILTSIPQIVIEARVVEVVESEEFAFGLNWFLLNREDHTFDPTKPFAPLRPTDTVFDRTRIGRGIPVLPGSSPGVVPNILTELGTIQDDIQIDLLISALKLFTKVDVVNAPNVAVLSGHTATVTAGQEVPYFELNVAGINTIVSVKFKQVNIALEVLPQMIRPDTIRMAVQVKVQNVTGVTTVSTGASEAANPVIASRSVTTTMDVRDGATVVLGGLISTARLDATDRVPILGEIPILEVLFSNRHTQDARTNLIFFLRPRILPPGGSQGRGLITPAVPPEHPPR
jgi:type II secretory pathway component GspD/PulD (secretin)